MRMDGVCGRGFAALMLCLSLAACGGGGGSSTGPTSLPPESLDVVPPGPRIDIGARNYFPLGVGDVWYYERSETGASGSASRRVLSGPDAEGAFTVSDVDGDPTLIRYRPGPSGVETLDPFQAQADGLPGLYASLPRLVEYPSPPYPVGAELRTVRQGSVGADLDGDGRHDSFRIEIRQVFRGFEMLTVLDRPMEVAHYYNNVSLTALRSSDGQSSTIVATEDAYFATDIGLVQVVRQANQSNGAVVSPRYTLSLLSARVGGVDYLPGGNARIIDLTHVELVADPASAAFYALLPDTGGGARIARIDAVTGSTTTSASVAQGAQTFAISRDGGTMYVDSQASGEVVRISLPDMRETGRAVLPLDSDGWRTFAASMAVSPTDPNVVAVALKRRYASTHGGVILLKDLQLQPVRTPEGVGATRLSFGSDGWIYGYDQLDPGLRRIEVLADGVIARGSVAIDAIYTRSFEAGEGVIVLGNRVYRADASLSYVGEVPLHLDCRKVPTRRSLLCHSVIDSVQVSVVDLDSLTVRDALRYTNRGANSYWQLVPGPSGSFAVSEPDLVTIFNSPRLP